MNFLYTPEQSQAIASWIGKEREATSKSPTKPVSPRSPLFIEKRTPESPTQVVIVDTNVLLAELSVIYNLIPLVPRIIVPWVVISELDALKQREDDLGKLAIASIDFLHKNMLEKKIAGQTLMETMDTRDMSNDDRILDCCFYFAQNSHVLLLTNDKNLAVKAMVHEIQTMDSTQFIAGTPQESAQKIATSIGSLEPVDAMAVDVVASPKGLKLASLAEELVTQILQQPLMEIFAFYLGDKGKSPVEKWLPVLVCKPPWTLQDMVKLVDKHWMAVFKEVYPKTFREGSSVGEAGLKRLQTIIRQTVPNRTILQMDAEFVSLLEVFSKYLLDARGVVTIVDVGGTWRNLAKHLPPKLVNVPMNGRPAWQIRDLFTALREAIQNEV